MLRAESLQITINSSVQKVDPRGLPLSQEGTGPEEPLSGGAKETFEQRAELGCPGIPLRYKWIYRLYNEITIWYLKEISGQYLDRDLYRRGYLCCKPVGHLAGDFASPVSSVPP